MRTNRHRNPPNRIVEREDIVQLLWTEVQKAGGQKAWAKKNGIDRTQVNKVLHGAKPPPERILRALGLRMVAIPE